ncbi:MAG: DNA helicase RecQ [Flavobacteriaceae bacterium]
MTQEQLLFKTLQDYFGFHKFRPLQEKIIRSVLDGHDNLVIMPTGGGKSICYQLPALMLEGLTIVISPLIALMKDQVDGLNANGISAAYLNSSQEESEQQEVLSLIASKELKMLYVAPESLSLFEGVLNEFKISLIAIDEAHCISSWGHDFRPAYTQLSYLKKRLPDTPMIALTATADKATRQDILIQLGIPQADQHIASFDRPNIFLEVRPGQKRIDQIYEFIGDRPESSGIVYCLSRKSAEQVAASLCKKGFNAAPYHAGLAHDQRARIQEDFIYDRTQIVCATIAFGMGIDKSNVRWVIHYNLPKNMEGYYQEIGRAGRDGLQSNALLFYSYADVVQLQKFASGSENEEVQLAKLDRMKQFTEATSCRRRILLSYFGEYREKDCGHCDVCKNPPVFFDGTVLAQKILSGIHRLQGKEAIGVLVDFLRGSQNSQIYDKGYQNLKTYGIARDIPWIKLQQYVVQMINLGYCEIAFHQHNALKLTTSARNVLFEGEKVRMTEVKDKVEKTGQETSTKARKASTLFEALRRLRLNLAQEKGIPAYLVFSDAALKQMEKHKPQTDEEFLAIDGVGKKKFQDYGYAFLKEISSFVKPKKKKKTTKKKDTLLVTYELYKEGLSIEEISEQRQLTLATLQTHYLKLFQQGQDIDLSSFVDASELKALKKARAILGEKATLRAYFEHFEEQMPYQTIKFGLEVIKREA